MSAPESKPAFIQCGIHSNFGAIFGIRLPDLTPYRTAYCNIVPHYINEKLTQMGAQYILPRVLTPNATTEVSQNKLITESLNASPKYVKLPPQEKDIKGIAGFKAIENIFRFVNIQGYLDINKIQSITSRQSRRKASKYALSLNPKFPAINSISSPGRNPLPPEDNTTSRTALKI